jgi:hypothetical protein
MPGAGLDASRKTISGSIRKRFVYFGEMVDRAVVQISPDRPIDIVLGPNRSIREANFASDRHLTAGFAHLPYGSRYAIRLIQIERRSARRER